MRRRYKSDCDGGDSTEIRQIYNTREDEVHQVGKAFYDYKAAQNDELSFERGSVVEIIKKDCEEQGWIYAKIGGREGMIPENYVRLVGRKLKEIDGSEIQITEDKVGDGSFSKVYRGYFNEKEVAVKVPKDSKQKKNILEDLKKEALIYARLNNDNVVAFFGICLSPPCLVLELCKGGTLGKMIRNLSYSIPIRVVNWCLQVCKGMRHLHDRDDALVHADLKPDNVLIKEPPCLCDHKEEPRKYSPENYDAYGLCKTCKGMDIDKIHLKLTDFGLARAESSSRNSFNGSLLWMAPEVIQTGQHTRMSDVYSFGIMVWELVTNQRPYYTPHHATVTFISLVTKHCPPSIPEDCPHMLVDLMQKCWRKEPSERPTFIDIIKELEKAQEYVDSTRKLDYRNSIDRPQNEDIDNLEKSLKIRDLFSNKSPYQGPKTAVRHGKNKPRISKDEISNPKDFKHVLAVHDNKKNNTYGKHNSRQQRYQIEECPSATLPRSHKHSAGELIPTSMHSSRPNKSSNLLSETVNHGHKRESYDHDCDHEHLSLIRMQPPLKTAKSNPELAGSSSLFGGKPSRIQQPTTPLNRSNATRKRIIEPNIVPVHKSSSASEEHHHLNGDFPDVVVNLADPSSLPTFRDNQVRGRNYSEHNTASNLDFSIPSTLGPSGIRIKKENNSIFYIDNELDDSTLSLNSQDSHHNKKKPHGLKNKILGLFGSTSNDTNSDFSLTTDRPSLPTCYHPAHEIDYNGRGSHLCALLENDHLPMVFMRPDPEFPDVIFSNPPNRASLGPSFTKKDQDPQFKRRAAGNVANGGGRTTASHVIALRKHRQGTSVSENEEYLSPETSPKNDIIRFSDDYEPVKPHNGGNSRSTESDSRIFSMDFEPYDAFHSRSRSKDIPETTSKPRGMMELAAETDQEMDWMTSREPISNVAYIPLQDSVYRLNKQQQLVDELRTDASETADTRSRHTKMNCPPIPPPRLRPTNLGTTDLSPPDSSSIVNWRSNHSPNSDSRPGVSPHRKKNILDQEVTGSVVNPATSPSTPTAITPTGNTPNNRRNTPEPLRRHHYLNTPISTPNPSSFSTSQSLEDDDNDRYELTFPIVNPTYRSRVPSLQPQKPGPPSQKAPPPPMQENTVPKYLPKTNSHMRRTHHHRPTAPARPTNFF